ncbi:MAG: class I SAM-dependent DNA methyltransferase [Methanotrichaceae archaeon]
MDNSHTFTLSELESHLWESANILRGPVDAADFKTYVFPLLFFKRISDVHDEEYRAAFDESEGDEEYAQFPQNYRFQLPEGCRWEDVRAVTANVGQALQKAMRCIETANPETLYGIFGDAQWTNKERLSDALLRDLIEHFSRIYLSNQAAQADVLGQSYEYLIKKFADATNKKAGEFYTPRSVVRLMVNILDPKEGESIYDPACGTGGMLLEAIHHVKEHHGDDRTLYGKLFGQEKNLTTSSIARMNLFLHGAADFQIVRGDTLRQPAFFSGDNLATFDCVIANPPFSLEKWGEEVWSSDPFGRNFAGMPPAKNGDFAWVQHMIRSMAPNAGRMAVVLPHGALFRMGKEGKIRQKILSMDLLEAVIGLGPNLFYGTGLAACILVFRQQKVEDHKHKVLIIDASKEFKTGRAQNELLPEHVERIYRLYRNFGNIDGVSHVATLDEIAANDYNLNITRYVEPKVEQEALTVEEAMKRLQASAEAAFAAEDRLIEILMREGLCDIKRLYLSRKPQKCPSCGAEPIATIQYGLPIFSADLEAKLQSGKIELGGCCVTDDDPVWACTHCGQKFYRSTE